MFLPVLVYSWSFRTAVDGKKGPLVRQGGTLQIFQILLLCTLSIHSLIFYELIDAILTE